MQLFHLSVRKEFSEKQMSSVVESNSFKSQGWNKPSFFYRISSVFCVSFLQREVWDMRKAVFHFSHFLRDEGLTWCGPLSHPFSTVCVGAVWSRPRSRLYCRPPFLFLVEIRVQLFQESFGLGRSPATSPQSTGSLPCRISPSLIPPVRGGRGGGGKRSDMKEDCVRMPLGRKNE